MMNIQALLAIIGLGACLSLAQTGKMGTSGPIGLFFSVLVIPSAVAAIWRIAQHMGWWTIAVFIAASLLVGTINGIAYNRGEGREFLVAMQPALGLIMIAATVGAWLI